MDGKSNGTNFACCPKFSRFARYSHFGDPTHEASRSTEYCLYNLTTQLAVREAEKAAERLYALETRKFILGESTLFIVNAREAKYLEAVQKRANTEAKWLGLEAELYALTSNGDPWDRVRSSSR